MSYMRSKKKNSDHNAPSEMSSKRPVPRFRQVVEPNTKEVRDPRFSSLSGKFNQDLFEKSYAFVDDIKKNELEQLKEKVKKNKDAEQQEDLKNTLNSELARQRSKENSKKRLELKRSIRKKEQELVKKGKKPFYLTNRKVKEVELIEQFNQIKDSGKLDKLLEKRRKKNATKEHRFVPFKRDHQ